MIRGKICVVTGGGSGIGQALCEELVRSGASGVYIVDICRESAQQVSASLPSLATHHHRQSNNCNNFQCGFSVADIGEEEDIRRVIHEAWELFGRIDVFFSNAGIMTMGGIHDVSNEMWEKIWKINVMSHVFAARHLFPLWRRQKQYYNGAGESNDVGNVDRDDVPNNGVFVITASAAGMLMQIGSLPYHVTKHAAVSVADWLAVHHHDDGVRVHCICPQAVQTNLLSSNASPFIRHVAELDGVITPRDVAIKTIEAIEREEFCVLPHPEVKKYFERKASDYDRWLKGMRRVHRHFFSPSKL